MNNAHFHRNRSSLQLPGKEFIIAVVVIFSALSFTLGYFVGKSGTDRKPENLSQPAEITPAPQKQETETLPQPQAMPVTDNTSQTEEIAKEHVQTQKKESFVVVEAKQPEPAKNLQPAKEKTQKSTEPVYAVQLGAFKSSSEAETIRKRYEKKGLKTYITTSTNTKKENIYKVKSGEFRDRKKAEVMSLKLNKTGKLKTFVTLKSE